MDGWFNLDVYRKVYLKSGAVSQRVGAPTYYLTNLSLTLHENEEILVQGGEHTSLVLPPSDPPLEVYQYFLKVAWKWRNFGAEGWGGVPPSPLLSTLSPRSATGSTPYGWNVTSKDIEAFISGGFYLYNTLPAHGKYIIHNIHQALWPWWTITKCCMESNVQTICQ